MADRGDANVLEVVGRQVRQQLSIDVILTECRLVLLKAQAPQPLPDIHHRFLRPGDARGELSSRCVVSVQAKQRRRRLAVFSLQQENQSTANRRSVGTSIATVSE